MINNVVPEFRAGSREHRTPLADEQLGRLEGSLLHFTNAQFDEEIKDYYPLSSPSFPLSLPLFSLRQ